MKELKIEIHGRVQGVGFRQFVKRTADVLEVTGYVRNTTRGTVIIVTQGEREVLEKFLRMVQRGPFLSKVSGLSYFWRDSKKTFDDFVIAVDRGFIEDQASSFMNLGKKLLGLEGRVPKHVAIIPDGNRRWAKNKGLSNFEGHKEGGSYNHLRALLDEAEKMNIRYVTFWAFSTENWNRDSKEVKLLFNVILKGIKSFRSLANEKNIRFRHVGRKDRLPPKIVKELSSIEEETRNNTGINLQLCLDYGGRDEIARAVNKMLQAGVKEIKEEDIHLYLDSEGIPDPDLIIRTSGEQRMSGFMPFQSAYAELYFSDVYFPDFSPRELRKAVIEFGRRKRNFGK